MNYPASLSSSPGWSFSSSNACPNYTVADSFGETKDNKRSKEWLKPPASLVAAKEISKAVKDAILSFQVPINHRRVPSPRSLLSKWGVRYEKDPETWVRKMKPHGPLEGKAAPVGLPGKLGMKEEVGFFRKIPSRHQVDLFDRWYQQHSGFLDPTSVFEVSEKGCIIM